MIHPSITPAMQARIAEGRENALRRNITQAARAIFSEWDEETWGLEARESPQWAELTEAIEQLDLHKTNTVKGLVEALERSEAIVEAARNLVWRETDDGPPVLVGGEAPELWEALKEDLRKAR